MCMAITLFPMHNLSKMMLISYGLASEIAASVMPGLAPGKPRERGNPILAVMENLSQILTVRGREWLSAGASTAWSMIGP